MKKSYTKLRCGRTEKRENIPLLSLIPIILCKWEKWPYREKMKNRGRFSLLHLLPIWTGLDLTFWLRARGKPKTTGTSSAIVDLLFLKLQHFYKSNYKLTTFKKKRNPLWCIGIKTILDFERQVTKQVGLQDKWLKNTAWSKSRFFFHLSLNERLVSDSQGELCLH